MTRTSVPGAGEVISFTTLHSPPEGFRSPLHIALVELAGGARFICHGAETLGLRIGSWVAIEAVGNVYYFSHLGALGRVRLFWSRAGHASERIGAIARSLAKGELGSQFVELTSVVPIDAGAPAHVAYQGAGPAHLELE